MSANQDCPPVSASRFRAIETPPTPASISPALGEEFCHCIFLDQVEVGHGVCRRQVLHEVGDLLVGDEYRLPASAARRLATIRFKGEQATITLEKMVEVGTAELRTSRTHRITLMSCNAHVVSADVLQTPDGRVVLAFWEPARLHEDYALIALTEARS